MSNSILTIQQITNHALSVLEDELSFGKERPAYYPKRKYGKWTIYNKEGMRVAWGLNEKEMKAYMKLLKTEE
jgi:hypothetical protein